VTEPNDPFSRPSTGNFPKLEDLEGVLLLLRPIKVEMVPNRFDKDGTKPLTERATADTVVFGPDGVEEYDDMYFSQAVLVKACNSGLKPGAKPFILGRLVKMPTNDTQKALKIEPTPEAFAAARTAWLKGGGKGTEPKHAWVLLDFTDDDAQRVREYLASKQAAADPFAVSS
jgi:hypothetical protein